MSGLGSRRPLHRAHLAIVSLVRGTIVRSAHDDITAIASQFAYNGFLATVPFLFLLVSVIGLLVEPQTLESTLAANEGVPDALREVLVDALEQATVNAGQAAAFLAIGVVGALYLSANVAGALIGGLDRARDVPHRPFLHGKLVALAFASAASVLVLVASLAAIGGPRLARALVDPFVVGEPPAITSLTLVGVAAAALLAFTYLLFRYGPNAPRRGLLSEVPGVLVGVALWLVAMLAFGVYLNNFGSYNRIYGSLGVFVIYLVFLFLSAVVLLVGAEVNEEWRALRGRDERGGRPAPAPQD